jgi:hypothetical protein
VGIETTLALTRCIGVVIRRYHLSAAAAGFASDVECAYADLSSSPVCSSAWRIVIEFSSAAQCDVELQNNFDGLEDALRVRKAA